MPIRECDGTFFNTSNPIKMISLQAAPDELFFTWQYYVQSTNFREFGLEKDMVILVGLQNGRQPSDHIKEFEKTFGGKIYYYNDTRTSKAYLSSIRPNLIKQYLKDNPTECFFFIDQDIIFLKDPKINRFENDPYIYTAKQAKGYTYTKYMNAFNDGSIYKGLCEIMRVDPEFIKTKDDVCGGAQYIIKGTDWKWWDEYENQLEACYKFLGKEIDKDRAAHNDPTRYNIQHWGTDLYAIWMKLVALGKPLDHLQEIDFTWPYDTFESAEKNDYYIMHNAGISEHNRDNPDTGKRRYFDKGLYKGKTPFDEDLSFIDKNILQYKYISYFSEFSKKKEVTSPKKEVMTPKKKILALWNSSFGRAGRKVHPELIKSSLEKLKIAAEATTEADVTVSTQAWQEIPGNPFPSGQFMISPFRDMGHLNYLLQLKNQLVHNPGSDIVVIIEHDVLTPKNYFNEIITNWDYSKYGQNNRNYIGINTTGYLDVVQRDHPMSMMSFATFFFADLLNRKIDDCLRNIAPGAPFGWICVEPDDKGQMAEFWSSVPCIHVSGQRLGEYEHNFTTHDIVCYERQSNGKVNREDWGNYLEVLPFLKAYQ